MKFQKQQVLADNWQQLMTITARYEANKGLERYQDFVDNFVMRVPLVGVFSAGKSTLLNRVLPEALLSADIDPKTCIATELYFAENEKFVGHLTNGVNKPLSKDDITNESFLTDIQSSADQKGWVSAYINSPVLAKFPHVCLVDLPGLDSNLISHNQMIDDYIQRSLAYCIVVSIEDGELKASTQQFLTELKINQMPVVLIITKSDRKPPEDVEAISQKITQSITQLLGREPIKVVTVSARKKTNIDELINAFVAIEERAEQRFDDVVVKPVGSEIKFIIKNIDKLINSDNLTLEQLQQEKIQLQQDMATFRQNLEQETRDLEMQSSRIVRSISELIKSRLLNQLESLAGMLVSGRDINDRVENTVRTALSEGIQRELMPTIEQYVRDVQHDMPISLTLGKLDLDVDTKMDSDFSLAGLFATITPILHFLKINPLMSVILPVAVKIINMFLSDQKQQQQQEKMKQMARENITEQVIPKVQYEASRVLQQTVNQSIGEAKQKIASLVEERNQQVQAHLAKVEENIAKNQAEQERLKQEYLADKNLLESIVNQLN